MVIDVRKLKFSGKTETEFQFDYIPSDDVLTIPGANFQGAVRVTGVLELHGDDVYVDGNIACTIVGECARCLGEARAHVSEEFSVVYAVRRQDEDDYLYKNGLVDLKLAINDLMITTLPTVIYCREDCKGLCHVCGQNLNEKSCNCKK
ncbi:MAG: DUF177 domain-containing protein [Clostridia bacterium]|nr:DUF177 domain-containing protein [Clostridia bacterium]